MIEKLKTINPYDEIEIDMDTNSVGGLVYENTPLIQKINELVDAINNQQIQLNNHECRLLDLHSRITALDDPTYHEEPEPADNSEKANCQDRMIGCTTLDIPESYKNDQLILATLDYSKKLEKENSDLKDELERTRKALEIAVDTLKEIIDWDNCVALQSNDFVGIANKALEQITALEQKDKQCQ